MKLKLLQCLILGSLALTANCLAKRPELDAVFWGNLSHKTNIALRPSYVGEIRVSAWLDGVKIAELAVPPSAAPAASRFILKVPIDDGVEPRLPGCARRGERIRLMVRNASLNLEYEINETENNTGLSLPTTKGSITVQNISLDQDLGGASPLMARYAFWKAQRGFQTDLLDSESDSDSDGMSNFAEFLANTDPQSGSDTLRIRSIRHGQSVTSLNVGPIKASRRYVVFCSRTMLADDWQKAGDFSATADAPDQWIDHLSPDPALFYRVEVVLQ
jgi:hypothetical protein